MRKMIAFALMSMSLSTAYADNKELYVGIAGTQAEFYDGFSDSSPGSTVDKKDTGIKIFGGYKLGRYVAAELSFLDSVSFKSTFSNQSGYNTTNAEASAFALNVVASLPVGERIELLGKAGFGLWQLKGTSTFATQGSVVTSSNYDSGNGLAYGAGANLKVTDQFKLRAEYDVIELLAELKLRTYSIGVIWQF